MPGNDGYTRRNALKMIGGVSTGAALLGEIPLGVRASTPEMWNSKHEDEYFYYADEQYATTLFNLQYHGAIFDEDNVIGEHWRHEFSITSQYYAVEWDEDYISADEVPESIHEYWHGDKTDDPDYPRDKVKYGLNNSYFGGFDYRFEASTTGRAYSIDDNKSDPYYHFFTPEGTNGYPAYDLVDRTFDTATVAVGLRFPVMGAGLAVTGIINEATTDYDENLNGNNVIGIERHGDSNGFGPALSHIQWFNVKMPAEGQKEQITIEAGVNFDITAGMEMLEEVEWVVTLFPADKNDDGQWHDHASIYDVTKEYGE